MTLSDSEEKLSMELPEAHQDLGETILQMIMKSFDDNRLICGVFDCAQQLEKDADHVMLCILPEVTSQEVPVRIQHTLIEAFCRENAVPVLKISAGTQFISLVASKDVKITAQKSKANEANGHAPLERKSSNTRDYNCFLVQRPDVMTSQDQYVKSFCESQPSEARYFIEVPA